MPPWKESIEAMLMILPLPPRATTSRTKHWLRKKTASMLMPITSSQSFAEKSRKSARRMMPAQFTRISKCSKRFFASAITPGMAARSPRFPVMAAALRPSACTCFTVSSAGRMSTATMSAPASASASAMPWPKPRAAPVTTATLPSSLKRSSIELMIGWWFGLKSRGDCSTEFADRRRVHVMEHLVVAAHRPAEAIIARPHPGVDRPGR